MPGLRYSQGYLIPFGYSPEYTVLNGTKLAWQTQARPQVQSRISETLGTVCDTLLEMAIFYPATTPWIIQAVRSSQTSGTVKDVRCLGYSLGYTA